MISRLQHTADFDQEEVVSTLREAADAIEGGGVACAWYERTLVPQDDLVEKDIAVKYIPSV